LESTGTVLRRFLGAGTVAACLSHAPPPLATRGLTRRREEEPGNCGIGNDLLSSSLPRRQWPAKPKKNTTKQLILAFYFFVFQICFSPFRSVSPQILLWFPSSSPSVQVAGGSQEEWPRRGGVTAGLASGCWFGCLLLKRSKNRGKGFSVDGSVGTRGMAGGGELVWCGRWRCSSGWLLLMKKENKPARRGG